MMSYSTESGNAPTILVVDDDEIMIRLLTTILKLEKFNVQSAKDGYEALGLIKSCMPELVVLDIMMPGLDGYDVLTIMRSDPYFERIPVIFLTARSENKDKLKGWMRGADEYITKPFSPPELIGKVKSVLNSSYNERLDERAKEIERLTAMFEEMDNESSDADIMTA